MIERISVEGVEGGGHQLEVTGHRGCTVSKYYQFIPGTIECESAEIETGKPEEA